MARLANRLPRPSGGERPGSESPAGLAGAKRPSEARQLTLPEIAPRDNPFE